MTDQADILSRLIEAVVQTDEDKVMDLVTQGVEAGIEPLEIVNDGLTAGLRKVGDLFAEELIFLPELVLSGEIVTQAVESLKDSLAGGKGLGNKATILLATVRGDVHDIGKNLVGLLLSASGYQVVDLGKDVATAAIVDQVASLKPDCLGLSALLSTTMVGQKEVVEALQEAGIRDKLKIMVGGAPVTRAWAKEIGADGFAQDASTAVTEADRLLG